MKQIFIIRHAKSSWNVGALSDFERPLNERGHSNAPFMAEQMVHKKIKIDALVSSTAVRAFTTATYFAKAYNKSINQILQEPSLYHAPPSVFYSVITQLNNSFNSVAIFAHNPGITQFVNQLTPAQIDDMPTCGIFAIESNIDDWKAFNTRNNKFLFFISPKSTS